jgi:hypothetical protein
MPFERFRFLNDDHTHEDASKVRAVVTAVPSGPMPTCPQDRAYVGTVYKSKEGAVGLHPDANGDRALARDVDVHFWWDGAARRFPCTAGANSSWQFLTVRVFQSVGFTTYHAIEAFGTAQTGGNLEHIHLGPYLIADLPALTPA